MKNKPPVATPLDTCLEHLAVRGRFVIVGFISEYAQVPQVVPQPRIYDKLFWKAASVRAFLMPHYAEHAAAARDRLLHLFYTSQIRVAIDPTPFHGIESIPTAVN
jgi:NADPH-dependent curcumin reductase CurA